jgi:hypothetical protein
MILYDLHWTFDRFADEKSVVNFLRNLSYLDGILKGPIVFRRNSAWFRRMKYASIFFFLSSLRAPKKRKKVSYCSYKTFCANSRYQRFFPNFFSLGGNRKILYKTFCVTTCQKYFMGTIFCRVVKLIKEMKTPKISRPLGILITIPNCYPKTSRKMQHENDQFLHKLKSLTVYV